MGGRGQGRDNGNRINKVVGGRGGGEGVGWRVVGSSDSGGLGMWDAVIKPVYHEMSSHMID